MLMSASDRTLPEGKLRNARFSIRPSNTFAPKVKVSRLKEFQCWTSDCASSRARHDLIHCLRKLAGIDSIPKRSRSEQDESRSGALL